MNASRRAEQGDEVLVGLGDGVPAVAEAARVAGDRLGRSTTRARPGGDRVAKLAAAVVAVDAGAQLVARGEVVRGAGRTRRPGTLSAGGVPWKHRQRLADDEAELRVERERAVVVGGLHEPDACGATIALAPSTASISARPTPSSCAAGSTVTGPTRRSTPRSSTKALPTTSPSRSATSPAKPSFASIAPTRKRVNSGEPGSIGRLCRAAIDSNAS